MQLNAAECNQTWLNAIMCDGEQLGENPNQQKEPIAIVQKQMRLQQQMPIASQGTRGTRAKVDTCEI